MTWREAIRRESAGLECIVDRAQTLETQQRAPELVLSGEDPPDGPEALLENGWIEALFAAPPWRFTPTRIFGNVGNHVPVEIRLAVGPVAGAHAPRRRARQEPLPSDSPRSGRRANERARLPR